MKKIIFISAFVLNAAFCSTGFAENNKEKIENDTIKGYSLGEVVVTSSSKETNSIKKLPGSVSVISPLQITGMQISDVVDISNIVPNFYIPDYGSKYSSPVYIRGVGNRSTSQASAMYVDNIPLINKSTYDFDFLDIQRIELLRGPQGTLYGRNAMGGIINVFTHSPLDIQRTSIGVNGGNYGLFQTHGSTDFKLNNQLGVSLSGYYDHSDGYFTNEFTGKKADALDAGGGRIRLDYQFSKNFKASLIGNYDYSDQGAYPYNVYDKITGEISPISYNDEGSYLRKVGYAGLNLEYKNDRIIFASTTSYQNLNDDMKMDQDYSPAYVYNIHQIQKQDAFTQELTAKSNTNKNYQWSFGAFGFTNQLNTNVNVNFGPVGIAGMLQPMLSRFGYTVVDSEIAVPGYFETPNYGGAIFHQSTYNNLLIKGLSITAGIRLDYEKDKLDYVTSASMGVKNNASGNNSILSASIPGSQSNDYTQLLPKIGIKYEINPKKYVYASASKGYNPGGYNIQALSELVLQEPIKKLMPNYTPSDFSQYTTYNPEFSWNYEVGFKGEIIPGFLSTEIALFYINIDDMQLTQFTTAGRKISNVGQATNKGFDINLHASITPEVRTGVNYGYTHAIFDDYNSGKADYKGNYLPFAPQHTLSVYASYVKNFTNRFIDQFSIHSQYNGAGRIYWTEANNTYEDFYGLLNIKAGVRKGICTLNLWTKNTLNEDYNTFYFEMNGKGYLQQGKPTSFGADLVLTF